MNIKELQKANLEHSILVEMQKNRIAEESVRSFKVIENYIARLVNEPFKRKDYVFTAQDQKNVDKLLDTLFNGIETVLKIENEAMGKYELDYSIKLNNEISRTRLKPKTNMFALVRETLKPQDVLSTKSKNELLVQKNFLKKAISRQMMGLIKAGVKPVDVASKLNKTIRSRNGTIQTISRTSTAATVNQMNIKALNLAGVTHFIYNATLDAVTSDECRRKHGTIYPAKEALKQVPQHPNCRCSMLPVYPENGTKLEDYKDLIKDVENKKQLSSDVAERFQIAKKETMSIEKMRKIEEIT